MAINLAQFSSTGSGFGQGAYDRARAAGLSDAQIRSALPSSGLTIGTAVGSQLGGSTDLYAHRGTASTGFGMEAYNRAINSGMTPEQIRSSLASSGLRIGDLAAQALNVNPGMTYLGYSPYVQASYRGNSGINYAARPQLAPRGYGMDGRFSSNLGYSPTLYIAGGTSDAAGLSAVFNTNFTPMEAGGGYSDPYFHVVNYKAPEHDPYRPFGGYAPQAMQIQPFNMPAFNYSIPGGSTVSGVKSAASSRGVSTGSFGSSTPGGMQIKSVNV